eukprot:g10973.t1
MERVSRISAHVCVGNGASASYASSTSAAVNGNTTSTMRVGDFSNVGDPMAISAAKPIALKNFINGQWQTTGKTLPIIDPLNGERILEMPITETDTELKPFLDRMRAVPKSGLHNPLKNVDRGPGFLDFESDTDAEHRYTLYGRISFNLAKALDDPGIADHFTKLIQRVVPKSYPQARGEVAIVGKFLQNFGADQVRFLARGFTVSGDHDGQQSQGYRFPYGAVMIIVPFNFPLEIPVLQLMGALYI